MSGRLGSPENWDNMLEIYGTCLGQSRTDADRKMFLVCLICVLLLDNSNNMQIVVVGVVR